jgi:hypothetical protein
MRQPPADLTGRGRLEDVFLELTAQAPNPN